MCGPGVVWTPEVRQGYRQAAQLMRTPVFDRGSESATQGAYKVSPDQLLAPTLFPNADEPCRGDYKCALEL